jgi:toxin ParE1/3/4
VTKLRYRTTKAADADYDTILRFTLKRWGKAQFSSYRQLLNDAITAVAREPDRLNSHGRDEVRNGIRSFHIGLAATRPALGRHVLYYRVAADGVVEIIRILHDRMELSSKIS